MSQLKRLLHNASWVGLYTLLLAGTYLYADNQTRPDQISQEAAQIHKAIAGLSDYGVFDWITFDIQGDAVILDGYASRPVLKGEAESVVSKVSGVESVMNNITVLPLSNFDDELRTRIYFEIYDYTPLSRYNPNRGTPLANSPARMQSGLTNDPPPGRHPIHIIVQNGRVTLKGVVDTEGDRILAGMQARTTPGVFSLENDLAVLRQKASPSH